MDCANHPNVPVAAYCRTCGKALCESCKRDVRGVIYCEDCLATRVQTTVPPIPAAPLPQPVSTGPHPAVAGVLGLMPIGIAQAYNGQYARGLVYLLTFVGLIWAAEQNEFFGILIGAFFFWQLIDGVRSAQHIQRGLPAPDPFGIDRAFGTGSPLTARPSAPATGVAPVPGTTPPAPPGVGDEWQSRLPLGAVILIVLGTLFLLGNFGFLHGHWVGNLWPVILLAIGGWLLSTRWPEIASGSPRGRSLAMGPVVLLVLGALFLLQSVTDLGFGRTFPILLIAIGLVKLWQRSAEDSAPTAPAAMSPAAPPPTQPAPDENSVGHEPER
jgi:hypothetical protein